MRIPLALLSLVVATLAQNEGSPVDYAPNVNQTCPDVDTDPLIRVFTPQNQTLHPGEAAYVQSRQLQALPPAWKDWIGDGSALGYNLSTAALLITLNPKIGIAISGGGYRAAQYGAGVLSALDARNDSAKQAGTGGLLQVSSYLSGLSGGSWITGSMYFNDFPTMQDLVFGNDQLSGWLLDLDLASPDGLDLFDTDNQYFFGSILWSVFSKAQKNIDVSLTDAWARMISYHFLNQTTRSNFFTNDTAHGAGQLWHNILTVPSASSFQMPFPLIMADSRPAGSNLTTQLAPGPTVYEITPLEFGSWDPDLSAMMNLTYAGTHLTEGRPDNGTACVTAFDQAGFIMGTSASLFNQILDFANNRIDEFGQDGQALLYSLDRMLRSVRTRADDVANWPNPFHGIKNDTFEDSDSKWLELIDGSSNGENVPLGSMFVKARGLDMIVAVDGSADDNFNWPNGSSILFTQSRLATLLNESHQQFPPLPKDEAEFISTGVRQRPTLFGCNPTQTPPEYPLVLYLPNAPPFTGDDPVTNTGTFQIDYTTKHSRLFQDQTHGNTIAGFLTNANTADPHWGTCLQCAAIDRARFKANSSGMAIPRSGPCAECFARYCFDPSSPPDGSAVVGRKLQFVDPDPTGVAKVIRFFTDHKGPFIGAAVVFVVLLAAGTGWLYWRRKRALAARYSRLQDPVALEGPWVRGSGLVFDPYAVEDARTPGHQLEFEVEKPSRPTSEGYGYEYGGALGEEGRGGLSRSVSGLSDTTTVAAEDVDKLGHRERDGSGERSSD
ncbi:phospholipase B [Trametopsis cervina]|nr:phospholipase B [Trametopsis cervina]